VSDLEEVKKSLKSMEAVLSGQLERRERVLKESRDVISACSRAIIDVHTGKMKEAEKERGAARALLASLKKHSGDSSRYLISPEAEYVEASAVIALAKGREVPSMDTLGASPEAYLLGLLDTVGELKRLVLDSILKRKLSKARKYFGVMEELYSLCSPLAVYDHVVNGARRKIDVARMLVEDTRGLLAEEMGRESVSASMARLEKKLKSRAGA
jgi:translin